MTVLSQIRTTERRGVIVAFIVLAMIVAAFMIMQTVRDAVFLIALPVSQLPLLYLGIAALTTVAAAAQSRFRPGFGAGGRLAGLLLGSAVVTTLLWLAVRAQVWGSIYSLYIWVAVFGTLSGFELWLVVGRAYTVEQAKRLYGIIGLGAVVGGLLGSAAAAVLTMWLRPIDVLGTAVAILVLASVTAVAGFRGAPLGAPSRAPVPVRPHPRGRLRAAVGDRYVRRLAALAVASGATLTLGDFWFKAEVVASVAPQNVGQFLGTAYAIMNVLSLVAQLLLTPVLLRTVGALRSLWVLPSLAVGAAGLGVAGFGIIGAVALKGADGAFRHTVDRTANEVVQLPIEGRQRAAAKRVIDIAGRRSAQALGAVLLLVIGLFPGRAPLLLALCACAAAWLVVAIALRPHYVQMFRSAVRRDGMADAGPRTVKLDLASVEHLVAALNSADDSEVIAAIDLLQRHDRGRLIPALILYHPSPEVVIRALEAFGASGRQDHVATASRRVLSGDPRVRSRTLLALTPHGVDESIVQQLAADPHPLVRATAFVVEAARTSMRGTISEEMQLSSLDVDVREAIAIAIGHLPQMVFRNTLLALARDPTPRVQAAAAVAMAAQPTPAFIGALLPLLAQGHTRPAAREALQAIGDPALARLKDAMVDPATDPRVRLHIPRTLSRFDDPEAAEFLVARLPHETDGAVHYKILRGLARVQRTHPAVVMDTRVLLEAAAEEVRRAFELLAWRLVLCRPGTSVATMSKEEELLVAMLDSKEKHAIERALRCLGLAHRDRDFLRIVRAVRSAAPQVRASCTELVEELVDAPLRDPLAALIGDAPDEERLLAGEGWVGSEKPDREAVLEQLRHANSDTLRALAARLQRVAAKPSQAPSAEHGHD